MISSAKFQKEIYSYYKVNKRDQLPWRQTKDPYRILVSEVMLQQTQVSRVLVKYPEFLKLFPTLKKLASAPLAQVLRAWQGLGYNRRALMLYKAAQATMSTHSTGLPRTYDELLELPGVGPSTAAGVMNFTHAKATPYLETNVRSVYLHFFFNDASCKSVSDKEILPILERTMDTKHPREWFYALLDYGVMLKKKHGNPNIRSAHYAKQSPFEGSRRQARAVALRKALKGRVSDKKLLKLLS